MAPRHIVFHLGFRKTGTTTIQAMLADLPDDLVHGRFIAPRSRLTSPWRKAIFAHTRGNRRKGLGPIEAAAIDLRDALAARLEPQVIISDENLVGSSVTVRDGSTIFDWTADILPIIARVFDGWRIDIVLYTRDLEKWLASCYNQEVKRRGQTRRYADWRARIPASVNWEDGLAKVRGATDLPLHVFSMEEEVRGPTILGAGLLRVAGVSDADIARIPEPARRNESLSPRRLELTRRLNYLGIGHMIRPSG